jgi:hypothetical protein
MLIIGVFFFASLLAKSFFFKRFYSSRMFCYRKQSLMRMMTRVPPPLTWHICRIVIDCFFFVVTICILNQYEGHWLLSGAFHFAISMSLRLRKEIKNAPSFQTLMEKDLGATFE